MSYAGAIVPILIGTQGLESDIAQPVDAPQLPYGFSMASLLMATNVNLRYQSVEKAPGSSLWSQSPLPEGIGAFADWWPIDTIQRMIVACKDGNIYRYAGQFAPAKIVQPIVNSSIPAVQSLTLDNQCFMVTGGAEDVNRPRKLFIFTGNDWPQVITGDGTVRSSMSLPNPDWQPNGVLTSTGALQPGSWPTMGVIHSGALWCIGNKNNAHTIYRSNIEDHEDFQSDPGATTITTVVYPGEGDGIIGLYVFKSQLYALKYPYGLYLIDDSVNPNAPTVTKISSAFGGGSAHCAIQVLNDMLIGNSSGSVSSLVSSFNLGNMEQADVLKQMRAFKYMLENTNPGNTKNRQAMYYEQKKQAMFSYQSAGGYRPDRIMVIDYHSQVPTIAWYDKDQPNCLGLVRDNTNIPRPFYGSEDGNLYQMDSPNISVNGSAYTGTFQTPHLDFGFLEKGMEEKDKHFDFIGITCEPTGNWTISGDVFVDGQYTGTYQFDANNRTYLDGAFQLDLKRFLLTGAATTAPRIVPIKGMGKRISVRFSQGGLGQGFRVSCVQFFFRPAGNVNR